MPFPVRAYITLGEVGFFIYPEEELGLYKGLAEFYSKLAFYEEQDGVDVEITRNTLVSTGEGENTVHLFEGDMITMNFQPMDEGEKNKHNKLQASYVILWDEVDFKMMAMPSPESYEDGYPPIPMAEMTKRNQQFEITDIKVIGTIFDEENLSDHGFDNLQYDD